MRRHRIYHYIQFYLIVYYGRNFVCLLVFPFIYFASIIICTYRAQSRTSCGLFSLFSLLVYMNVFSICFASHDVIAGNERTHMYKRMEHTQTRTHNSLYRIADKSHITRHARNSHFSLSGIKQPRMKKKQHNY